MFRNCFRIQMMALFMAMAAAVVPLDEYVSAPESVYKWEKLHDATFTSTLGNTVYVLNVTSLDWLDVSKAYGPAGSIWSHMVYVFVPEEVKYPNVSNAYLTGDNNREPN